ncbi:ABC transporter permease [Neobacillus sp. LXY-1]|uniref:ABC transporter permease n=1 Tax=Neobacillus sp. LXY-1 TaxID=3379133 RepID=UPI003EE3E45F
MRKIRSLVAFNLKKLFKSPGTWVLMFVMPCLFGSIFGGIAVKSGQTKPLVNIITSNNHTSNQIAQLLKQDENYKWERASLKKAKENVSNEDAIAAIVIPDHPQNQIHKGEQIFTVIIQRKTENYLALEQHIQGTARLIASSYQTAEKINSEAFPKLLEAAADHKGIMVKKQTVEKDSNKLVDINLMFVGFAIMFMMFGLSGAASTILDERVGGTWGRLLISPARKSEIMAGYLLSYFLMGWIQLAVLMLAMSVMFDTGWGNLVYLIPFASLVIITVTGFGLMIAGLVKTKQQAGALSAILIVSTCMLGGVYWSIELVPDIMQKIALVVPQSWAMSGFKEIISGSLHGGTMFKDSMALIGFSVLFYIIGLRGMRFE